ncbi:hypothetical protein FQA91_32745, partial [Pseudomonas aeruginosa]
ALARSQATEASAGVLPGAGNAVQAAPRASSGAKSADEFIGDMWGHAEIRGKFIHLECKPLL